MVRITTAIQQQVFPRAVRDVRMVRTLVLPGGIVDVTDAGTTRVPAGRRTSSQAPGSSGDDLGMALIDE